MISLPPGQRPAASGGSLPARCGGLLLGEWTKIRSVFCGWTALLLAAGAWLLRRRDTYTGRH
jgi:hypothetical protein